MSFVKILWEQQNMLSNQNPIFTWYQLIIHWNQNQILSMMNSVMKISFAIKYKIQIYLFYQIGKHYKITKISSIQNFVLPQT